LTLSVKVIPYYDVLSNIFPLTEPEHHTDAMFRHEWIGCKFSALDKLVVELDLVKLVNSYQTKSSQWRSVVRHEAMQWIRTNVSPKHKHYNVDIVVLGSEDFVGPIEPSYSKRWFNSAIRLTLIEISASLSDVLIPRFIQIILDASGPSEQNIIADHFLGYFSLLMSENSWAWDSRCMNVPVISSMDSLSSLSSAGEACA
jgi:hypothetical protein